MSDGPGQGSTARGEQGGSQGSASQKASGNLARTQLANERTFLAWVRTAITSIALGLVAAQFLPEHVSRTAAPLVRAVALALIVAGIFEAVAGRWRYDLNLRDARAGRFRPTSTTADVTVILTIIAGAISIALVLLLAY